MMKLGLFLQGGGHHIAAWRDPNVEPNASQSMAHYINISRIAERAKFDMVFTADTQATFGADDIDVWRHTTGALRLEPLSLFGAIAATTDRIGLVSTATTTYYEPYHIARIFASLDQMSGGRCGWNLVTSAAPAEAYNFNRDVHVAHADRYERAAEFADVVLGLWDSWEGDAIIANKATGELFDPAKLHFLNHKGKYFSVRGPLTIKRSPQGRPVIVQAGQSEAGRELAAATAEVIFTVQQDVDEARSFYADIKRRAVAKGRSADSIKIMPGVMPIIGRTREEAEAKLERLQELIHPEMAVRVLSAFFGMDLSSYPLDAPLPEPKLSDTEQGRQQVIRDLARRENLTIQQVARRIAGVRGHRTLCGTPMQIADSLESWFTTGAADGFNIMPATFPDGLNAFAELVLPELRRRKLFREDYEGKTLRENLGLEIPENRWTRRAAPSPALA
jgi:FMN-dependent oxidoreductase (nitrilotriacetate monooxygenase family)